MRVEEYPFAREAIREAIYNAIAHNCYMYGTPIQIRVMEDAITISNRCILPENWTVETLMERHDSIPYNPDIANVFYRAGFIENWGQGIQKICDECREIGADLPVYELTGTVLRIQFKALERALIDQPKGSNRQGGGLNGGIDGGLADRIISLIGSDESITVLKISETLGIPKRTVEREIKKLRDSNCISREGGNRYGRWRINQ